MTWAIIAFLYVSGALLTADYTKVIRPDYPAGLTMFVALTWPLYGPIVFGVRVIGRALGK